ncbi:MAG: DUF6493 family protein [Arachnia propionica]|uniref:DUF6493 family protein n=1 Tax=Arachnia propionica TaxID=1750 RepID=UPI0026F81802|nr:DUF6493 family protein [Arachnia propionica]
MGVNMTWFDASRGLRWHTVVELEKVLDHFFALEPSLVEVHAFLLGLQAQHGELPSRLVGTAYQTRLRELFEGLEVEHDEAYVRTLVTASEGHRLHLLRRDERMRELIWQVLAWDGGTDDSLASLDRSAYGPRAHWASDIASLVAEGLLDRPRVLRACLAGLLRDLPAYHANWFSGLYTELRPTPQEAATDQDLLLRALDTGINATVSMATRQLAAVQRAGRLDSAEFLDHCHPPLTRARSIALTGVRIIQRLDAPAERKAEALAIALSHPHADVQIAAAEALRGLGVEEVLREGAQLLSPAVAAQFGLDVAETVAQEVDAEIGSALRVWAIRMREVVEMVRGQRPRRALLATPSDGDGWITWDEFAERAADPTPAPPADLFQGIWRLRPDERERGAALVGVPVPERTSYDEEFWQDLYTLHPQHLQAVALAFPDDTSPLVPTASMAIHRGLAEVAPRQLDRGATGMAKLLTLLCDEQVRRGRATVDPVLRGWLEQFSGGSAAAKAARRLLDA